MILLSPILAFRPFLDPLPLHAPWATWLLLPPLVLAIALVYRAMKLPTLDDLAREALQLTLQIVAMLVLAAAGLYVLIEWVV